MEELARAIASASYSPNQMIWDMASVTGIKGSGVLLILALLIK